MDSIQVVSTTQRISVDAATQAINVFNTAPTVSGGGGSEPVDLSGVLMRLANGASIENLGAVESNVRTVMATGSTEPLDVSVYSVFDCTMNQSCTFSFLNPAPPGKMSSVELFLRGAFIPTFPASVHWAGGTAPTYASPSIYTFRTIDGGTTWFGALVGSAFAASSSTSPPDPGITNYVVTLSGDRLTTLSGDALIWPGTGVSTTDYLVTFAGDRLVTLAGDALIG